MTLVMLSRHKGRSISSLELQDKFLKTRFIYNESFNKKLIEIIEISPTLVLPTLNTYRIYRLLRKNSGSESSNTIGKMRMMTSSKHVTSHMERRDENWRQCYIIRKATVAFLMI